MKYSNKLFHFKRPYDVKSTEHLFVLAMKENAIYQYNNCADYKRILVEKHFSPFNINSVKDLEDLPFLPTLYFKHHELFSMKKSKLLIKATSSGTSGIKSKIGFDLGSLIRGFNMVKRVARYHKLWSIKPVHYLIFGYEPNKNNQTAIAKTAFGFTFFAPALSRDYVLRYVNGEYKVDLENLKQKFIKYSKAKHPIRTLGFPAYTYFLLKEMQNEGIHLTMPKGSIVSLGGGWKNFYAQKVEKKEFYALVKDVLGIKDDHIVEFFGAVEHPILYTDCKAHHFHIPIYSRVIIRDVDTFSPLGYGKVGIVNLLTPMVKSVPVLSIMTDDLGILHDEPCSCGETSPWLEIIGRVGIADIVTCASGAEEYLKGSKSK